MNFLSESLHCPLHAIHEEPFRVVFPSMAVRSGDQFLGLRYRQCSKQLREDRLQRATEPHVEEVRQLSVADVVVVGGVRTDNKPAAPTIQ